MQSRKENNAVAIHVYILVSQGKVMSITLQILIIVAG